MGVQTDPSKYNFNSSGFATYTDANGHQHTINEQGREIWQSEYNNNVRETRENEAAQRRRAQEAKKQQQADESRRKQFDSLMSRSLYKRIEQYVKFFNYDNLVKQYEKESALASMERL